MMHKLAGNALDVMHKLAGNAQEIMHNFAEKALDKATEQFIDFGFNMGKKCIDLDSSVVSLKRKMKELSSQESDIECCLDLCELSGKKKRKREVDNWLKEVKNMREEFNTFQKHVGEGYLKNLLCGDCVEELDKRVVELIEQKRNFKELVLDAHENLGVRRLTGKLIGGMMNENLKDIVECLKTHNITCIGIHGSDGMGKTTLAKHINNHLLDDNFHVCWLTISQGLSIKWLQDNIAKAVGVVLSEMDDEETRAIILSGKLKKMENFVIILDGVRESFCLKKLGNPLSIEGCRLILTTPLLKVCCKMDCKRVFEVKPLNTEEAWELFKDVLHQETELPTEVEEIAKSVAESCAGLPSRIVTVAESMKGVEDICEWRNALAELQAS